MSGICIFFFFSSRRRHTRSDRDWSSDVCSSDLIDYHAGENETSSTMASRPDLVHLDRAASESGSDQKRVNLPEDVYTGIWWYARFPNHYSGDGSVATRELGEWNMNNWIASTVEAIRVAKADDQSLKLQNEFYEKSKHPLDTRP